jgi:crossover junction endodeoxyribonuclease RuvC
MRVLGVDPGLTRCGLAAVDGRPGRRAELVAVDVIRTPSAADIAARLLGVGEAVEGWIEQLGPDVVAVERVFSQRNVRTVMGTAQAAGVAVLAAARAGVPVALHTPSEVKAAVTGSGRAGKDQVAAMVTRILGLPAAPSPADASDALALAICHLWRDGTAAVPVTMGAGAVVTPAQRRWVEAAREARRADRNSAARHVPDDATLGHAAARRAGPVAGTR